MERFRIRCKQGALVITDECICIELGQVQQRTMLRSALVGVDSKVTVMPLFGMTKGASTVIFRGQGLDMLQAELVATPVAPEIVQFLQGDS